jgi:hypothetical protein
MGFDLSVDERVRRWHELNAPFGDPNELDSENAMETVAKLLCPSEKTPVARATLLGQMDLDFLEPVLLKWYKKRPHYHPVTMFRGAIFAKSGKISGRGLPRYLKAYPDQARQLGFVDKYGELDIPCHEHFRTFAQTRVDWDEIRDMAVVEVHHEANRLGIPFGEETADDATMVETVNGDPDGRYNGHYKKTGLKEDIMTDVATGVPIFNVTIGGTECEGHVFIGNLEHLKRLGIPVHDAWVDGTYATLENIAVAHTQVGTTMHYQPQESWVMRDDGAPEHIQKVYQTFWGNPDFHAGADLHEMMGFLVRKGRALRDKGATMQKTALTEGAWGETVRPKRGRPSKSERAAQDRFFEGVKLVEAGSRLLEPVGAYHRNAVMERAEADPVGMKKDKGKRQISESINDQLKNDLGLQDSLRVKGIEKVHIHNTMGCVFLLLMALHKLRNGVTTGLISLVGIE